MIDHEAHLKSILETQRKLANEITELNNILSTDIEQFDLNFFIDPTSQLSIIDQAYEHLKSLEYYKDATEA